jgi:pimeloyl-ACP methyl ester carboxylesterase
MDHYTPIPVFSSAEGQAEIMRAYQAILDRWPVPYSEISVPTSFGDTYVIASGPEDGPPIVLLHALLAGAASWYHNVGALSQQYRVYAVDVIGEGNHSCPTRPIKSLDDFLQWFTELIDYLELNTLYLAGNSYGGFTGAYYTMKLPGRIRKLILIGPAATIYKMTPFYIHMFIPKAVYLLIPRLPGLKGNMRRSLTWMYDGLPQDPLWDPLFYNAMVYGGLINQVFPRVYTGEEFARIQAPVLLILGENEQIYNPKAAVSAAKALIPSLQVELIPKAHHIAALAQPEIVNQRILRFLAE